MSVPADVTLGAHFTPEDRLEAAPRYFASYTVRGLPATYDLRGDLGPARNQKKQSACVAFAVCTALEFFNREDMAPQFIYNCRRNTNPFSHERLDDGMFVTDGCDIAVELGCPFEEAYPYQKQICTKDEIAKKILDRAQPARALSYARIKTVEGAKSALVANGPVIFAVGVWRDSVPFWIPRTDRIGGHCMAFVGWNEDGFIVRNSWGSKWNGDGHTVLPWDHWVHVRECWTLVDDPTVHPQASKHSSFFCCCK